MGLKLRVGSAAATVMASPSSDSDRAMWASRAVVGSRTPQASSRSVKTEQSPVASRVLSVLSSVPYRARSRVPSAGVSATRSIEISRSSASRAQVRGAASSSAHASSPPEASTESAWGTTRATASPTASRPACGRCTASP